MFYILVWAWESFVRVILATNDNFSFSERYMYVFIYIKMLHNARPKY